MKAWFAAIASISWGSVTLAAPALHTVVATDVSWEAAGTTVHGTLTVPVGDGPFPGVLLIAGSGPADRDWRLPLVPGDNGSGRLLARELGTQGIAVLRYDKRGSGETALPDALSWQDYTQEQRAGLQLMVDDPRVSSLVVAGHSEGGAHALRLAESLRTAGGPTLAGVALLAAPGRSMRDLVLAQVVDRMQQAEVPPDQHRVWLTQLAGALDDIASGRAIASEHRPSEPSVGNLVAMFEDPRGADFTRELLTYDPRTSFAGFEVPVLIVTGAKDIQVSIKGDAKPLEVAARRAGREVTRVDLADADHVLKQEMRPRSRLDALVGLTYNADGRKLDPELVPRLVRWISEIQ